MVLGDNNTDRLSTVYKTVDGNQLTNSYGYLNDRLSSITHNGFNYNFGYDSLGNNTTVSVGNQNLITNSYEPRTGKLLNSTYGNGQQISSDHDSLDRVTAIKYNGTSRYTYEYDASGNIGYAVDSINGVNYRYIYDISNRPVQIKDSLGNIVNYSYDGNSNASNISDIVNGTTYGTSYGYDKDNRLNTITYNRANANNVTLNYDSLGRVFGKTINTGAATYNTSYGYLPGVNGSTTNKVATITNNGARIDYTYDANGNIETITQGGKTIKYYYNELNELRREDNQVLDKTIVYNYDIGGNITTKEEYHYTTEELTTGSATSSVSYSYTDANWKDKLMSYNGKAITYDAIGNPLNDKTYDYTWEMGRQLKSINKTGQTISYKYNDSGIRTEKTVNGVTTKYHLVGDQVTFEANGTDNIYYTYDSNGKLVSMNLSTKVNGVWSVGEEYFYVRNAQGDIIGLIDKTGTQVVSYNYDSWGKMTPSKVEIDDTTDTNKNGITGTLKDSVGVKNPYRYRGYRYDTETGLYYLQSRYYNPEWGRFINAV